MRARLGGARLVEELDDGLERGMGRGRGVGERGPGRTLESWMAL